MVYAQNPSGKYMIPMPHQLQISTVVTCDVIDAVGEFLAAGKQLLQIAETARHRLTPRVDDACVRQHQVNQSQVPEVVRHLVDEKGQTGAVDPGSGEIALAELQKVLRLHLCQYSRIARISRIGVEAAKIPDDVLDVGEFLSALDLGVRRQNLFKQG